MKTKDFISKHLNTNDGIQRTCSSVFTDGRGNFYSYGYHYPLITRINNQFYVNDKGYSITTAKHISWAYSALNYKGLSYASNGTNPKLAAEAEYKANICKLTTLRKNAFRVREQMERRQEALNRTINSFVTEQGKCADCGKIADVDTMGEHMGSYVCHKCMEINKYPF